MLRDRSLKHATNSKQIFQMRPKLFQFYTDSSCVYFILSVPFVILYLYMFAIYCADSEYFTIISM